MSLFKLRGPLSKSQSLALGLAGFVLLIAVWFGLAEALSKQRPIVEYDTRLPSSLDTTGAIINIDSLMRADSAAFANATSFETVYPLLPRPDQVLRAYPKLVQKDTLIADVLRSIWLNLRGYFWALFLSIPLGFAIGLVPLLRGLFSSQVDAMRYLPLTALTGLFIVWFGIEDSMKIAFLAFGIIVYLLPVVVQRIFEVETVYLQTVFTLGGSTWQTIRSVYLPSVLSKLIDDIRVLTAISWTYIIIAELLNRQGGVGSLIYVKSRQGYIEEVFAILIVIIAIGFVQDRLFVYLDRRLFPHKYHPAHVDGLKEVTLGVFTILGVFVLAVLLPFFWASVPEVMGSLAAVVAISGLVIILYGESKMYRAAKA